MDFLLEVMVLFSRRNQLHLTVGQVARAQHVQAESYLVYGVMSSGEVECSNSLEDATDQALPSQAFVYRPVRQRVYSLLLGGGAGESWSPGTVRLELILRTGQMERVPAIRTQDLFLCKV